METANTNIDKQRYSFWELLSEYQITIPIIQRDYAQGRDNPKANIIREEILKNIHTALTNDKPLDFDFVYGTTTDGVTTKRILYPLDGQQRLTTLFLLHWYLAVRDKQISNAQKTLTKFTYETRISSREFCARLTESSFDFANYDDLTHFSNEITDANWFFIAWHHDPTIQAMLHTIDSIHEIFSKSEGFFEKLTTTKKCPITFQFIPLEKFGLTDDLYIKMNARGKLLTDFEIFKARFEHFLDEEHKDPELKQEFVGKLDGDWTNFFWSYRTDNHVIDTPFMRFFWFVTEMLYFCDTKKAHKTSPFEYDEKANPIIDYKLLKATYRKKENIEKLFSYLDILRTIDGDKFFKQISSLKNVSSLKNNEKGTVFLSCIAGTSFSLREKIILFAIMEYCRKLPVPSKNDEKLNDFVRVVQNFLQYVRQRKGNEFAPDILVNALHDYLNSIDNFISEKNIYSTLATEDLRGKISGQNFKDAYEHEKTKAECITKNPKWRPLIHRIESHPCFNGLIYNILYPNNIEKTAKYFNTLVEIWDKEQKGNRGNISRAWLSVVDYKIKTGDNIHAFGLGDNDRDSKKWHFIFTFTEKESDKIQDDIGTFFDAYNEIKTPNHSPNDVLQTMIDNYLTHSKSESEPKGWRWYFIQHEDIFSDPALCYFHITDDNILSLGRNNHRGYRCHTYLWCISQEIAQYIKSPYEVSDEGWLKGWGGSPLLEVDSKKGYIQMSDSDKEGVWEITVSNWSLSPEIKKEFALTKVQQEQSSDSVVYELKVNSNQDRIERAISFFKQILTP